MIKLIVSSLFIVLSISSSLASQTKECRLLIRGFKTLIDHDVELEESVSQALAAKGIQLIQEADLREGDYTTDFTKRFEDYGGLPVHEYIMSKDSKFVLVPCFAFPLCSPIMSDSQVTSIDGIRYKDVLSFKRVTKSTEITVFEKYFKHTYRGETLLQDERDYYLGSPEHIDLVHAIAKKIPHCSKLIKN